MRPRLLFVPLVLALTGCATFAESVSRGVWHYEADRFGEALAVWTEIEGDVTSQARAEQGEYYTYLALTHLRLGHRSDARHYLAISRQFWGVLTEELRRKIREAEEELGRSG